MLPAQENTIDNYDYFVRDIVTPETISFTSAIAYGYHDIAIIGNYVGCMEATVAAEALGSADIHEGMILYTQSKLGTSQNAFAVESGEVWYDIADMLLYDTYAAGRVGIGHITLGGTKNADGGIEFRKRRLWVPEAIVPTPET